MLIQRTTLKLNQEIYKLAKKRAIDEEINFQELVNMALKRYLERKEKKVSKKKKFKFGSFDIGGLKTKIDRKTIYEDRPKISFAWH